YLLHVLAVDQDDCECRFLHHVNGVAPRFAADLAARQNDDHAAQQVVHETDFLGNVIKTDAGRVLALDLPSRVRQPLGVEQQIDLKSSASLRPVPGIPVIKPDASHDLEAERFECEALDVAAGRVKLFHDLGQWLPK